eukprot:scpid49937/ scgid31737/ NACHT, LRR and PYD domains-containing protein 3
MANKCEGFPRSLARAQEILCEVTEAYAIRICGGLLGEEVVQLGEIVVNLSLVSEKQVKEEFDDQWPFTTYAERREHTDLFSRAKRVELTGLFNEYVVAPVQSAENAHSYCLDEDGGRSPWKTVPVPVDQSEKACGSLRNVLVYGAAGSGKTTIFLLLIAYLWSRGELWQDKFDLVLGLELHKPDVMSAKSLADLIAVAFASARMSVNELSELAGYFESRLGRLCLVLDGLDEYDEENSSTFMKDLLKRNCMAQAHVIITTRPCRAACKLSKCGEYGRRVHVLGFSQEDVSEYAEKVLGAEHAHDLLAEIAQQHRSDVVSLMAIPMFTAMTCELYRRGYGLWTCGTALYESILRLVVQQTGGSACESLEMAPAKTIQSLYELGRFAFRMLLLKRMVFEISDISSSHLSPGAAKLGLLQPCQSARPGSDQQCRFCHLSVQEFLAAWYTAQCVVQERNHAVTLVQEVGGYDGHMVMFWKFLIALCPQAVSLTVMEQLWCIQCDDPIPPDPSRAADKAAEEAAMFDNIHCGYLAAEEEEKSAEYADLSIKRAAWNAVMAEEVQDDCSVLSGELETAKVRAGLCRVLTCADMTALADVLNVPLGDHGKGRGEQRVRRCMPVDQEPADGTFLQTLLSLWMETNSTACGARLLEALQQVNFKLVALCENLLRPAAVLADDESALDAPSHIVSLSDADSSENLFMQLVSAHHERAQYNCMPCDWEFPLFKAMLAAKLMLAGVSLSSHDCVALTLLLCGPLCADVRAVNSIWCHSGAGLSRCISLGAGPWSNVRELNLSHCGVRDGQALSLLVGAMAGTLEVFYAVGNQVGVGGFVSVCTALCRCSNIRTVNIKDMCNDGAVPLPCICTMLERCGKLESLHLDWNTFASNQDDELRFFEGVKRNVQLKKLCLSRCGATSDFCSQLAAVFKNRECLKEFHRR